MRNKEKIAQLIDEIRMLLDDFTFLPVFFAQLIDEIRMLLDEPSNGFQDEGERWEQIVNLIEDMLKEIKK